MVLKKCKGNQSEASKILGLNRGTLRKTGKVRFALMIEIKTALISVYKKDGVLELAQKLRAHNVKIISSGGTASFLRENDIPVVEVSDYTGSPEMFGGRVKTLHPKIHAGILARGKIDESN